MKGKKAKRNKRRSISMSKIESWTLATYVLEDFVHVIYDSESNVIHE